MISVIIPVYNSARYLQACIESVFSQTYRELEILAIDDGSTDESPQILEQLAERDSRLQVIHQENAGVSAARNRGLEAASGEYITFIDSDDTLEPDLYETLLGLIYKYGVDIAHCSYNRVEGPHVKPIGNSRQLYSQTRAEALECFLAGKLYIASCCNKLYASYLFDDIRFREDIKMSEDLLVNIAAFEKVEHSVFWDICKYNYVTNETSACRNTPSLKKAADHTAVARELCVRFEGDPLYPLAQKRLLNALLSAYKAQIFTQSPNRMMLKHSASEIRTICSHGIKLSKKQKIDYLLMRYAPRLYKPMYRLYDKIRVPNLDV